MTTNRVVTRLAERDLLELVDAVGRRRGVTRAELCGRRRTTAIARARQEAWWLLRNDPLRCFSYTEIASLFERDHSTVLAGVAAHARRLVGDPSRAR